MNENWPRWFFASISKHFDDNTTYKMFVEGEPRETWETQDFFECRIDGPDFTNLSKNLWLAEVDVSILVQSVINYEDMHRIHKMAGEAAAAFDIPLVIYQYNDGDAVLSCLELIQDARSRESINISHFGQININQSLLQATVGGRFKTNLVTA